MVISEVTQLYSHLADQQKMASAFGAAMLKLSLAGQDKKKLIDCSDVIPQAKGIKPSPHFPAGLSNKDIEQSVSLGFVRAAFVCLQSRSARISVSLP